MYTIKLSGSFKKAFKLCLKRGYNPKLYAEAVAILQETGTLPEQYRPHKLEGKRYKGLWEAHIAPDWLIVWDKRETELVLVLMYTGTHADLFK